MSELTVDLGATWLRAALKGGPRKIVLPAVPWRSLPSTLRQILKKWRIAKLDRLTVGSTRIWTVKDRKALARPLRSLAHRVDVVSDMELAHHEAFGTGRGIVIIAGTGSVAYGRNAQGRSARAGGLGPWLGDEGSAFWIGREALRDPRISRLFPAGTALKLAHSADPIRSIAALAPKVLRAASRDAAARRLRGRAIIELTALVTTLATELRLKGRIPLALRGGLLSNGAFRKIILARLKARGIGL